jgi:Tol biopolymer transport system component
LSQAAPAQDNKDKKDKKDDKDKKDEKKKGETLTVKKITQGLGFYGIGPLSPDGKQLLLLAKKPDGAPNVYIMDIEGFAIRPPMTSFEWGAADPSWSPDALRVAVAGFGDTATFSEIYSVEVGSGKLRRLTSNNFTDKEPVFTPDGKRVLYTTDESPLPDAAFGILHIGSVPISGGKSEYFTEDEVSTIRPAITLDAKSMLLVKIDEHSGRHSLWQYGLDGKPQRDITERRFARIHGYTLNAASNSIVIWAQEEIEQQEGIYLWDVATRQVRELPDPDLPKRTPTISPNGKLVAFVGPASTGSHLFLFDSESGQIQQVTNKGTRTHSPLFISNDKLLFGSDRDKAPELYLLDLVPPPPKKEK